MCLTHMRKGGQSSGTFKVLWFNHVCLCRLLHALILRHIVLTWKLCIILLQRQEQSQQERGSGVIISAFWYWACLALHTFALSWTTVVLITSGRLAHYLQATFWNSGPITLHLVSFAVSELYFGWNILYVWPASPDPGPPWKAFLYRNTSPSPPYSFIPLSVPSSTHHIFPFSIYIPTQGAYLSLFSTS